MLNNAEKIHDQYTDRSGSTFVKMASRLASKSERKKAFATFDALPDRLGKLAERASFSVATPEDTYISRIYFEGEKHLMKEAEAENVEAKIAIRERLYGIERPRFKQMKKTAEERIEFLPGVSVSNYAELVKLGEDFDGNYGRLDFDDRIAFSKRFAKYACAAEDVPESVRLYAGCGIALRDDAVTQLGFRKAAAIRMGKRGAMYDRIADAIENTPRGSFTDDSLRKLAEAVHDIDRMFGFDDPSYDRRMPDAWHALLKSAEEESETGKSISEDATPTMTKSDIVARFGEQALDEVENEDGSIDEERLRRIMDLFGDKGDKDKSNVNAN